MGLEIFVTDKVRYLNGTRLKASSVLPSLSMFCLVSPGGSADVLEIFQMFEVLPEFFLTFKPLSYLTMESPLVNYFC